MNLLPITDSLSTASTAAEGAKHTFFDASLSADTGHLQISISPFIWGGILLGFIAWQGYRYWQGKKSKALPIIKLTKVKLSLGGQDFEYEIKRNHQNQEIAHRIYTELMTRKAALPFDEEKDVVEEVYNSWYHLFEVTREELKSLTGESLAKQENVSQLIDLLTDVLNKGLRPHLTTYQAEFRKWYEEQKEDSKGKSPQEIQQGYDKYNELVADIKRVNGELKLYADQLREKVLEWPLEDEGATE